MVEAEKKSLEVTLVKVRNSRQVLTGGLSLVSSKSTTVAREYRGVVGDLKREMNDMKNSLKTQLSDAVLFKMRVS